MARRAEAGPMEAGSAVVDTTNVTMLPLFARLFSPFPFGQEEDLLVVLLMLLGLWGFRGRERIVLRRNGEGLRNLGMDRIIILCVFFLWASLVL